MSVHYERRWINKFLVGKLELIYEIDKIDFYDIANIYE